VKSKRVLLRAGFDVPMDNGKIRDDARIREVMPSVSFLKKQGAKVIVISHNGRPSGVDPKLSLRSCATRVQELLKSPVKFVEDCVGPVAEKAVAAMKPGDVLVLENLRFHAGEEDNDPAFVEQLAKLGDVYVNDAFPNCHRKHASMVGLPAKMPSAAGFSLLKELHAFAKLSKPERPYVVVLGGAKADKLPMVVRFAQQADLVLLGGVLANTFLAAEGYDVGASKMDVLAVPQCKAVLQKYGSKILIPEDVVVADSFSADAHSHVCSVRNVNKNELILDLGHHSIESYARAIEAAKTVVWAGPIGVFEWEHFREGTSAIAHAVAASEGFSLVGGGDSGDAVHELHLESKIKHVSTGGGASLVILAGDSLPAVVALG
jgi:phosphoglycerate kinase